MKSILKKFVVLVFVYGLLVSAKCNNNNNNNNSNQTNITLCSFNIKFLGHYKKKDNAALSSILDYYDIVVIQELIAPPQNGNYPNGDPYTDDTEAKAFIDEMKALGFVYVLSLEDTGPGEEIHKATTSTEWWIIFYKADKVKIADDLPKGFLANDRSNNPDYERVPYAFAFRTINNEIDFVLISVHLKPGSGTNDKQRRKHELLSIKGWIENNDNVEKDFIILGDMNIENSQELSDTTPTGYQSLNDECHKTNTSPNTSKPYDHVMYNTTHTTNEIYIEFDLEVIDLIEVMRSLWTFTDPYPGDPYDSNLFPQYYSDHHPVIFKMKLIGGDDD